MRRSQQLFAAAQQYIPGGVNSPVRAFRAVGGDPVFIHSATGAYLIDEDGKKYVDYVGSWGPMILGHAHPEIIAAVRDALPLGLGYGATTAIEVEMAELICELMPSIEKVRMVNSGTEATMSAIRLARGFTGRDKIVKFEGCYHGHADALLVKAGSGALTLGIPTSPGVPESTAAHTITLSFNDATQVRQVFAEMGEEIACVIVEPVAGNMNCVPPLADFLPTLREVCDQSGSVLIFDEVMTGFRVGLQGAQGKYGIRPDLTTLGKVIGGGLPVGAFGGRADIMSHIAPEGPIYQAGTLSGNPIALTAGLTTLRLIQTTHFFEDLDRRTNQFLEGLKVRAQKADISFTTNQVGAMFGLFFTAQAKVTNFNAVMACDSVRFAKFFTAMLDNGVYLAPSAFEAGFVSSAHAQEEIEITWRAAEKAFSML